MARVIHTRLSDESIYTAIHILQSRDINTENLPIASIIRRVFEGVMNGFREENDIPMPENVSLLIDSVINKDNVFNIHTPFQDIENVTPVVDEEVRANIVRAMEQSVHNAPPADVFNPNKTEDAQQELPPEPWLLPHILTPDQIKELVPLNTMFVQAVEKKDEPLMRTLQVVYSDVKVDDWDAPDTVLKINATLPLIKRYFKAEE